MTFKSDIKWWFRVSNVQHQVWDDVELDLPMESPQLAAATAISCASTLVRRISRNSLGLGLECCSNLMIFWYILMCHPLFEDPFCVKIDLPRCMKHLWNMFMENLHQLSIARSMEPNFMFVTQSRFIWFHSCRESGAEKTHPIDSTGGDSSFSDSRRPFQRCKWLG